MPNGVVTAAKIAVGTASGIASSFSGNPVPQGSHQVAMNIAAQGGRVATDAFRHSLRHSHSVVKAVGASTVALSTAAAGGASAAAAAAGAAAVAAAPFVLGAALIGGAGYLVYKIFED